ncbi:mediator of RNA polymerase II transcription subunit 8 [Elasticomyces elasticus]|uniref:Mediator of RNA polymerase II transcription subunit 8 n=1 Tax=Exophiala sideris TaxID=1016849 RepID=A0ABR0J4S4_9EURO|nr:mediator of RNA polymerase II transcription subunit 8 [Elasticomyces elasticus]KAK5027448.1 mediator of RNA polymerase II transcription subunit 8 [Exophiala sideris]KAK5034849.1 mediator of RNA polymerase II transcription subunit 8 [Exophiala sideris]KAK5056416.1 mediator of RNA polymerase II transcription subunit 8 [Exophiala sideris]KAK5181095.1 mediator of RNA polymerase II transcription subunit 8 [Eurotiomycetes sp. CCFEE 6388]
MAALTADQVKSLDQARLRLLALHTSLVALRSEITTQSQLPSWPSLQTHANLVSNNMQQIVAQLSEYRELFQSTVAFPLPQFPGKERAFILETLLRTKLEPSVEEWIEEGQRISADQNKGAYSGLSDEDRSAFWQWAPGAANKEARKQKWGADYTTEEVQRGIQNVITGLRRELVEPPDDEGDEDIDDEDEAEYEDDDEEDEDKMDVEETKPQTISSTSVDPLSRPVTAAQMPLQVVHKYMTTGR